MQSGCGHLKGLALFLSNGLVVWGQEWLNMKKLEKNQNHFLNEKSDIDANEHDKSIPPMIPTDVIDLLSTMTLNIIEESIDEGRFISKNKIGSFKA